MATQRERIAELEEQRRVATDAVARLRAIVAVRQDNQGGGDYAKGFTEGMAAALEILEGDEA